MREIRGHEGKDSTSAGICDLVERKVMYSTEGGPQTLREIGKRKPVQLSRMSAVPRSRRYFSLLTSIRFLSICYNDGERELNAVRYERRSFDDATASENNHRAARGVSFAAQKESSPTAPAECPSKDLTPFLLFVLHPRSVASQAPVLSVEGSCLVHTFSMTILLVFS